MFQDEKSKSMKDQRPGKIWHERHKKNFRMPREIQGDGLYGMKLGRQTPELKDLQDSWKDWIVCYAEVKNLTGFKK